MSRLPAILFCSALISPSWAALKPISEAAVAVSLDQDCRWEATGKNSCVKTVEYRVLQNGGREFGSIPIHYPASTTLEILEAYTINPAGRRMDVADKDKQHGDVAGENGFIGQKFVKIAFPEVVTGSRIILRTRETENAIKPFTAQSMFWRIRNSPVNWSKYNLRIQSDEKLFWTAANLDNMLEAKQSPDGKTLQLSLKQPVYREASEQGNRLKLRQEPRIEVSTEPDARRYLSPMAKAVAQLQAAPLPPKAQATVNKVKDLPRVRQLSLLLADVKNRIRYMGDWRQSVNGFVPFSLAEIEQRGFGDCKDMALTLTAMLRAVGIEASVSIVRADMDNTPMLMTPLGYFNHAIVHVKVDGKDYWLDPTLTVNTLGSVPPQLLARQALLIAPNGEIRESDIAAHESETPTGSQELDFYPDGDGAWRVSAKAQPDLLESAYYMAQVYKTGTVKEIAQDLLYPGMTLLKESLVLPQQQRLLFEPQTMSAELGVKNVTREVGDFRLLDLRLLQEFIKRIRDYQQKEGVSDYRDGVGSYSWLTRVHGVKPLAPVQACKVSSKWRDFEMVPVAVEGGVGIRQKLVRKVFWIPAAEVSSPEFGKMVDEVEKCNRNAQILLAP